MKSGDLEEERRAKQRRVERCARMDRVWIRPRVHNGPEVVIIGVEGGSGYCASAQGFLQSADYAHDGNKGNQCIGHCMARSRDNTIGSYMRVIHRSWLADLNVGIVDDGWLTKLK